VHKAEPADNQPPTRCVSRRTFLALAGSTTSLVLMAACGGATAPAAPTAVPQPTKPAAPVAPSPSPAASPVASPVASPAAAGQLAPAAPLALPNLSGVSLSVLAGSNFIPDLDPFFTKQIQDDFVKNTGATVSFDTIAQNDIATRISAAVQSGSGPDLILQAHNWAHLYADNLVDVSDVVSDVKKTTGDFYPQVESNTNVNGKYMTVPHDCLGIATLWRKSMFKEVGYDDLPKTYDDWHTAGAKLKEKGHPLGQCLGHSINDPNNWCYTMMWGYGGREVDEQGKVAINSPETIAAVRAMKDNWKPAYDETGLAWDDSSNNRAFLAETISATQNGASIWWVAKNQDKKSWLDDIGVGPLLAGPKGQVTTGVDWSYGIMGYSKNVEAAKTFLRWAMSDPVWIPWFKVAEGFSNGVGPRHDDKAPWSELPPVIQSLKTAQQNTRAIGWPGPANQQAALALAKFLVVDMFARAVQGDTPEAAVAWAESEYKQIYT
jgi:multiple sugar transport system substrate-binding protein